MKTFPGAAVLILLVLALSLSLGQCDQASLKAVSRVSKACQCRGSHPDLDGLLCYPNCPSDSYGVGPLCHRRCPPGFRNDGLFCAKPKSYGRGAGFPWKFGDGLNDRGMYRRCESKHGRGKCEKHGAIVYPKSRKNFHAVGCCVCSPNCPGGFPDIGVSCAKPLAKGRGAGKALPCIENVFSGKAQCVQRAINKLNFGKDFVDTFNAMKNERANFERGICTFGTVFSRTSPLSEVSRAIVSECGAMSVYMGVSFEGSLGLKGSAQFGVVTDPSGKRACYKSLCTGGGLSAGGSVDGVIGAVFSSDIMDMGGSSVGFDFDVKVLGGAGYSVQVDTSSGVVSMEIGVGAGAQANLGSFGSCKTSIMLE